MDEQTLIHDLADLASPKWDGPGDRAAVVAERVDAARMRRGRVGVPRLELAALLAVVAVGLTAFAVWTAPGQAAASWTAERLGIGDPGGHPSLEELRASWNGGTVAENRPAYVLVKGSVADSGQYEFITYRGKAENGAGAGGPCFELDLAEVPSSTSQGCGVFPEGGVLYSDGFGGGFGRSGGEAFYTAGRVSPEVGSVEVELDGTPVPVELVPVPQELLTRFEIGPDFAFYIASLPHAAHGGRLSTTAIGGDGQVLDSKTTFIPDLLSGRTGFLPGSSE